MQKLFRHLKGVLIDLVKIFWPPAVVFILQVCRVLFFPLLFRLDMVAHFFGGLAIAWAATTLFGVLRKRKIITTSPQFPLFAYSLITTVALVGVLWEFMEFVFLRDALARLRLDLYHDTINDLALDILGACVWTAIVGLQKKQ
ncbi:hypothetical protein KBD18_00450 [Patescibacteria group bacterium]|nr:hypothetical protein [Patescibacteria group bacterium]